MTEPTPADVVRRLRNRPGRGGVRLTYAEADVALRIVEAGVLAIARERGLLAGKLVRVDVDTGDALDDPVELAVEALGRDRTFEASAPRSTLHGDRADST